MSKVSFVIPCYASEHTISLVVQEVNDAMGKLKKYEWEFVLVNDCSPDNTFDVIKNLCAKYSNIIGINLARNFGQHAALMAGFNQVTGDIVVCLDDDGQTPGDEVGKLLDKVEEGFDVVYAKYANKKHSGFRNMGSKLNSKMTEYLLDKPKDLFISSYFAARRFIVDEMVKYEHSFPYVTGLVLRSTRRITNVEVTHRDRVEGVSGYSIKKLISLWSNGFTAFSVKPLRLATIIGMLFAMIGFIVVLVLVIRKLLYPSEVLMGWSSTMSVLMMIGGIILIVLGIIGEYIGRIYICINQAPQYIIREKVRDVEEKKKKDDDCYRMSETAVELDK